MSSLLLDLPLCRHPSTSPPGVEGKSHNMTSTVPIQTTHYDIWFEVQYIDYLSGLCPLGGGGGGGRGEASITNSQLSEISGLEHRTGLLDWTTGMTFALKINSEKPC